MTKSLVRDKSGDIIGEIRRSKSGYMAYTWNWSAGDEQKYIGTYHTFETAKQHIVNA